MSSRSSSRRARLRLLAMMAIGAAFFWAGNAALRARRIADDFHRELAQRRRLLDAEVRGEESRLAALEGRNLPISPSEPAAAHPGPVRPYQPNDPKIDRFFLLRMYPTGLAVRFAQLYQLLGLSPAQISQFEGLMTGYRETRLGLHELQAIALSDGTGMAASDLTEIEQEARNSRDVGLRALLGEQGFQQLLYEERIDVAQGFLVRSTQGGYPPEPLSASQAAQMIAVMESTSSSFQAGGSLDPAALDWNTVLARTRGVLSPEQIESLQAVVEGFEINRLRNSYFGR